MNYIEPKPILAHGRGNLTIYETPTRPVRVTRPKGYRHPAELTCINVYCGREFNTRMSYLSHRDATGHADSMAPR